MTIRQALHASTARAMFNTPTFGSMMTRGPQVCYAPEDDNGGGGDDENAIKAALEARQKAEKEAEEARKAQEAEDARKKAEEEANKNKPSDEEARLLKDTMKHKKAAQEAQAALAEATAKLKQFDGLDADELKQLIADKQAAELKDAEKRGEYDRIIKQVREDAEARVAASNAEIDSFKQKLADAQKRMDDLVVGSRFGGSQFINESTVLSGDKARRLYGDHFEIENGELIAYDKPRGSSDRTPLVNTTTGSNLDFEAAIEKIVKADPDFERIAKSKLKSGSGSNPSDQDRRGNPDKPKVVGVDAISYALSKKKR